MSAPSSGIRTGLWFSVLIAAFGYFVDLYDIAIFGVVRVPSLEALGVTGAENTRWGIHLLNLQMIGLLIGGLLWGVVGDKLGRRVALIATITCYSLANIANAYITSVDQYAVLRVVAGIGLAGELGAGVALVSEVLPPSRRAWGVVAIALLGMLGSLTAAWAGGHIDWRTAYLAGGIGGLIVLVGRIAGLRESALFEAGKTSVQERGDLRMLVASRSVFLRLLAVIAVGVPVWYAIALLINFAPEFGKALGIAEPIRVSTVAVWQSIGVGLGTICAGALSERWHSRRRVLALFIGAMPLLALVLFQQQTPVAYAHVMLLMGAAMGYWSVYLTMGAEQFGTNLRALVSISVPNFVRATTVLITLGMSALAPLFGWLPSAIAIGIGVLSLAFAGLAFLRETWGVDLDFQERAGPA